MYLKKNNRRINEEGDLPLIIQSNLIRKEITQQE